MQFIKSSCHCLTFHLPATTVVKAKTSTTTHRSQCLEYSTLGQNQMFLHPVSVCVSFFLKIQVAMDLDKNGTSFSLHPLCINTISSASLLWYTTFFVPNIDVVLSSVVYEFFLISFVYFSRLY